MDTHFEQSLPRSPARPELSLPGENEQTSTLHAEPQDRIGAQHTSSDAAADRAKPAQDPDTPTEIEPGAAADEPIAKPTNKRRSSLMTTAAIGVTLVTGTGLFLISPYNHIVPLNLAGLQGSHPVQPGATQHIAIPAPVAPAANLARAPNPQVPAGPSRSVPTSQPRADDVQEILNFRPSSPRRDASTTDKPAEDRSATTQSAPQPPVASVEGAGTQPTTATLPATTPIPILQPVATAAPATLTITSPAPRDPVTVAATLQAAPMTTPQQVDVLNVVTELGTLLRNQRAENAQLREDVQQMREKLDTQLSDYARRLSLAEARGAIGAAMGAGSPIASIPTTVTPASITVVGPVTPAAGGLTRGFRNVVSSPSMPSAPLPAAAQDAPRRYRVQAASPGLAMLAEVDRTGDAGNLLQVSIGDEVPGYGKVKSIAQQGAAWVLTAERGSIR